jgi:hypothetical protein
MAKQIKFTYDGVDYTLEFTRATIQQMENEGFVIDDVDRKPMTMIPKLFAGAFREHHRFTKQETISAIYDAMPNKEKLLKTLGEMYNEPMLSLIDEPEKSSKNVNWEVDG